jgi:hypothetical protein
MIGGKLGSRPPKMEPNLQSATSSTRTAGQADFLRRLRNNKGYKRLATILRTDPDRLLRLERSCWLHHCAAAKNEFKGPRAKRAQVHLERLRRALDDPLWLKDSIAESLKDLGRELDKLASRTKRGRPRDSMARAFFQNMQIFIPLARASQRTNRSISQEEIDEIFSEIFSVVFGRRISRESYTRMRVRHKVRN